MNTVRCFIAIDIEPNVKHQVDELMTIIGEQWYVDKDAIKWVKTENLHITLAFLGNVPIEKISLLCDIIESVSKTNNPFKINLEGLGFFPNIRQPKVFWIGINKSTYLLDLKRQLDVKLQQADISYDKKAFSPHITIARLKKTIEVEKQIINNAFKADFLAKEIHLVKSELFKDGPIYTKIYSAPLKKVLTS